MNNHSGKVIKLSGKQSKPAPLNRNRKDCKHHMRIGTLSLIRDTGDILVDFPDNPLDPIPALSTIDIRHEDVNRSVLLAFDNGDPQRPVITGFIKEQPLVLGEEISLDANDIRELFAGEENVVLDVRKRFEIRCGKSSFILHEDGKVVIKGTHIVSRASEVNKIKGAAVKIN